MVLAGARAGANADRSIRVSADPADKAKFLASEWAPTFDHKPISLPTASDIISSHSVPLPFHDSKPPRIYDFERVMKSLRDSSPGPDGLPYSAWRKSGLKGCTTLFHIFYWLSQGLRMPISFNSSLLVFPPRVKRTVTR